MEDEVTMFRTDSVLQFPPSFSSFLQPYEVLALGCTNKNNWSQVKKELYGRRQGVFDQLMYYWYYCNISYINGEKHIVIHRRYDDHYYKNVRILFQFLPELFDFIEKKDVHVLDFSCLNSYGGDPECPERMLDILERSAITKIGEEILTLLSKNTTLSWCNLGLFEGVLERGRVEEMIQGHPTLDHISLRSHGSSTYYNEHPTTLYRNRINGTFYWSHFRDYEI